MTVVVGLLFREHARTLLKTQQDEYAADAFERQRRVLLGLDCNLGVAECDIVQVPDREPIHLAQVVEFVIYRYRGRLDFGESQGLARLHLGGGTTGTIVGSRMARFWLEM